MSNSKHIYARGDRRVSNSDVPLCLWAALSPAKKKRSQKPTMTLMKRITSSPSLTVCTTAGTPFDRSALPTRFKNRVSWHTAVSGTPVTPEYDLGTACLAAPPDCRAHQRPPARHILQKEYPTAHTATLVARGGSQPRGRVRHLWRSWPPLPAQPE